MLQLINWDAWAHVIKPPTSLIDWAAWAIIQFDSFWWELLFNTLLVVGCVWVAASIVVSVIRDFDWYW